MSITISPRRAGRILILIVLLLTFLSLAGYLARYVLGPRVPRTLVSIFDVDVEGSIPNWYASFTLLVSAALLGAIARATKTANGRFIRHWQGLSVIFLVLSIEEVAAVHERTSTPLQSLLHPGGFFYFAWVIPGSIIVLALLLAYLRFLIHLPRPTKWLFLIAGTLFVGGAIGLEMIGGRYAQLYGFRNPTYGLIVNLEEFLEMVGIAVFIYALLAYMRSFVKEVRIRIDEDGSPPRLSGTV